MSEDEEAASDRDRDGPNVLPEFNPGEQLGVVPALRRHAQLEQEGRDRALDSRPASLVEDLKAFLRLHGVTPLGIQQLEPRLPAWGRMLRRRGVSAVPDIRLADKWTPAQHDDYIQIVALMSQASQAAHKRLKIPRKHERMLAEHAHQYRDMARMRDTNDS